MKTNINKNATYIEKVTEQGSSETDWNKFGGTTVPYNEKELLLDNNTTNTELVINGSDVLEEALDNGDVSKVDILNDGSCLALYEFDNNSDDTSGVNNLSPVGSFAYVDGKYGQGITCTNITTNPADNYIDLPVTLLNNNDSFAISLNIKVNNFNDYYQSILSNYNCGTDPQVLTALQVYNGGFHYTYWNRATTNTPVSVISNAIDANKFYNIVINVDKLNHKFNMYVNGVMIKEINDTAINSLLSQTPKLFGWVANCTEGTNNTINFDGVIDQVRIFNKYLTQSEVDVLYTENKIYLVNLDIIDDTNNINEVIETVPTVTPGMVYSKDPFGDGSLVAKYLFDGDARDLTGNHDGVVVNTTDYLKGKFNKGLFYKKVSNVVKNTTIPVSMLDNGNICISVFIKKLSGTSIARIMYTSVNSNLNSDRIGVSQYGIGVYLGTSLTIDSAIIDGLEVGIFHHYVYNFTPNGREIYINNILVASDNISVWNDSGTASYANEIMLISDYYGYTNTPNKETNTIIDQLEIYNRALTQEEITKLYQQKEYLVKTDISPLLLTNPPVKAFKKANVKLNMSVENTKDACITRPDKIYGVLVDSTPGLAKVRGNITDNTIVYVDGDDMLSGINAKESVNWNKPHQQNIYEPSLGNQLGTWVTESNTLIDAAYAGSSIVTSSRVYLLGGYDGSAYTNRVQSAPINPDGTLGTWITETNTLPSASGISQAVVTSNRVYLLGGWNGSGSINSIYSCPINPDGTLGTWVTETNTLPNALEYSQAIITGSRVYLLGGRNGGTYLDTIYSCPINPDGTLGTWITESNTLPSTIAISQAIVTSSRVYLLGGNNGSGAINSIYSCPINPDGTLGTWVTDSNTLPDALYASQAIVTSSRVYLLGGRNSDYINTIYSCPINPDGTLGTWITETNTLPNTQGWNNVIVSGNNIYMLGYTNGTTNGNAIYRTTFEDGWDSRTNDWKFNTTTIDVSILGLTKTPKLITTKGYNELDYVSSTTSTFIGTTKVNNMVNVDDTLVLDTGMNNVNAVTVVDDSVRWNKPHQQNIYEHSNGNQLGTWVTEVNTLPSVLALSQAIVTSSRVYLLGGWNDSVQTNSIYSCPINPDGTLGAWVTETNTLPSALSYSQAIVTSNRVYLLGGYDGSAYTDIIYSCPINPDGTLGTWITESNTLPSALYASQAVVINSRVYLLGGYDGAASVNTIYSCPINPDGTLSTWVTESNILPGTLSHSQAIVTGSRVYLLGGFTSGTGVINSIYSCPINQDGTLGTWVTETNTLPSAFDVSQAIVTSSRVYLLGGRNGTGLNTIYSSPINPDGTLGTWVTETNTLPNTLAWSSAIVMFNKIYTLGGSYINGTNSIAPTDAIYSVSFEDGWDSRMNEWVYRKYTYTITHNGVTTPSLTCKVLDKSVNVPLQTRTYNGTSFVNTYNNYLKIGRAIQRKIIIDGKDTELITPITTTLYKQ